MITGTIPAGFLTPCLLWDGRRFRDGYGEFVFWEGRKRSMVAHRAAWIISTGRMPGDAIEICHRCDNRACVNPEHLFEGTHSDNEKDKVTKGRHVTPLQGPGERGANAKITDADALEIRQLLKDPAITLAAVGARFEIAETTIRDVAKGRTFSHLPLQPFPRRRNRNSPVTGDGIRCSRCRTVKPSDSFPPSHVKKGHGWCRGCMTTWEQGRVP